MELKYVQEFVVLCDYMSFSQAAEELFLNQSTLSKHIRVLENDLGGTLINRTTRSLALSEFGAAFLPYAKALSRTFTECDAALEEYKQRHKTLFTIAAVHHLQWYNATKYFVGFYHRYPNCRINVIESDERGIAELFRSRRVNLMTVAIPDGYVPEYGFIPVAKSNIVVMFPKGHALERCDTVTLQQLAAYNLILPDSDSVLHDMINRAFHELSIVPNVVYTGSSIGGIDLIKAHMGVSLQASEHMYGTLDEEICWRNLAHPLTYQYGVGYRENANMTDMERAFLDYMRTQSILLPSR